MALLVSESFDTYGSTTFMFATPTSRWSNQSTTSNNGLSNGAGFSRFGYGWYCNNTGSVTAMLNPPLDYRSDHLIVGFARKFGHTTGYQILKFFSDGASSGVGSGNHTYFTWNGTPGEITATHHSAAGSGSTTSSGANIVADVWYYLEFRVKLHDTLGEIEVRKNGQTILQVTGVDTNNNATIPVYTGVQFTLVSQSNAIEAIDDLYVCDTTGPAPFNTFLGDIRIESVWPDGDGTYQEFDYRPANHLPNLNQHSVETDATGFEVVSNCTLARSTAQASVGVASLEVTSLAGGTAIFRSLPGTAAAPVDGGVQYVAHAYFRSASTARTPGVGIDWYDADGAYVSSSSSGAGNMSNANFINGAQGGGVAPLNARYAAVRCEISAIAGAGEIFYVDNFTIQEIGGTVLNSIEPSANHYRTVDGWRYGGGNGWPDVDYVRSTVDDERETFTFAEALSPATMPLIGVTMTGMMRAEAPTSAGVAALTRLGGVDLEGGRTALPQGYGIQTLAPFTEKPGGGAWTVGDANGAEFGVRVAGGTPTTYTLYPSVDGYIASLHTDYPTARLGAALTADAAGAFAGTGQAWPTGDKYCWEGFLSFDTSAVIGTITAVTLSLWASEDNSTTDFTLEVRLHNFGTSLDTVDWVAGDVLATKVLLATLDTASGVNTSGYNVLASEEAFVANINQSGLTQLLLNSSRHRLGTSPGGWESVNWRTMEHLSGSQGPKLVIEALV